MLFGGDVLGGDEVVRQSLSIARGSRFGIRVDQLAVGQQLERKDVDLLLRLLALAYDIPEVVVRERRLDAVGRIVGQRQRDRAGGRNRGVVCEARTTLGQLVHQLR